MGEEIKFSELLQEIQPAFLSGLAEDIKEFREFLDRLASEQDDSLVVAKIYRMAHNLRGNGASYGFPVVSEIGKRMEETLKPIYHLSKRMDETRLKFLADCVDNLENIVQKYKEQQM
jgi:chemotaxis protein histidine kinase CheA